MNIKILGTGCPKCRKLYEEVEKASNAGGFAAHIEKVEKLDEIMKFRVMMTPGLVIDDEVKSTGRIPSAAEITAWLKAAAEGKPDNA